MCRGNAEDSESGGSVVRVEGGGQFTCESQHIPLKSRAGMYQTCIRSGMLCEAETPTLNRKLMKVSRTDRRMLRCMAGIRWQAKVSSADMTNKCGAEDLGTEL